MFTYVSGTSLAGAARAPAKLWSVVEVLDLLSKAGSQVGGGERGSVGGRGHDDQIDLIASVHHHDPELE